MSVRSTSHLFSPQIGTSYMPTVMMSYCPPPVATSWVMALRRSPSSKKMMLTLMSGWSLLNSGNSRFMSCIWGLLTLAKVMVVTPGGLPSSPNPAQPEMARVKLSPTPASARRRCLGAVMHKALLMVAECLRIAAE